MLAEKIGVSRAAVARWELGEIEPKLENLVRLALTLQVSTDELLGLPAEKDRIPFLLSKEAAEALERFIEEVRK